MNQEKLNLILENHEKWLNHNEGGERATLVNTNLKGTNLKGANLRDATMGGVNLAGANLEGADLKGSNLIFAYLTHSNLNNANLAGADLQSANIRSANLTGADLRGADLRNVNLRSARLKGAKFSYDVPVIEDIHKRVYEAASQPDALDMEHWHACETTHCRAGWVISLAGEAGKELEKLIGINAAAALIYQKSDPELKKVPDWFADNEDALADMKRLAGF